MASNPEDSLGILEVFTTLGGLIGKFLIGLIFITIFPGYSRKTADYFAQKSLGSLLRGILIALGVPIFLMFVFFTIIGIPAAILGLLIYLVVIWFATLLGAYSIGVQLLQNGKNWLNLLIGVFVFWLVGLIPVIGAITQAAVTLMALGAMATPGIKSARQRTKI